MLEIARLSWKIYEWYQNCVHIKTDKSEFGLRDFCDLFSKFLEKIKKELGRTWCFYNWPGKKNLRGVVQNRQLIGSAVTSRSVGRLIRHFFFQLWKTTVKSISSKTDDPTAAQKKTNEDRQSDDRNAKVHPHFSSVQFEWWENAQQQDRNLWLHANVLLWNHAIQPNCPLSNPSAVHTESILYMSCHSTLRQTCHK